MNYQDFLTSKSHSESNHGIEPGEMSTKMFDYQEHVARYAIKKGRCAVFLDTGLGKTIIELVTAKNYAVKFNKPVLVVTPLAIAHQHLREAKKFSITDDIEYSKDGKYNSKIVLCNYERLHYFNPSDFVCVILDESSILKNFDGAIKANITSFMKKVQYRFLFTATPSPNDFIELGTSSEALGYLGYMDMLSRYFTNNEDTISPMKIGVKWVLKGHAEDSFFQWVSTWAIVMRKPSDLGFSNDAHQLPELITKSHEVKNPEQELIDDQYSMFAINASRMSEVRQQQRQTIESRCNRAVELTKGKKSSVYWVNFNNEGDLIESLDKDSVQIKGGMSIDKKEEILIAFQSGEINRLITKAKMTSFGLNWQHCNHTVFFPTFSYEQYYQAIRRFWRFGQKKPVTVDLVVAEGQHKILNALKEKARKSEKLFSRLRDNVNRDYLANIAQFDKKIQVPSFL